MRTLILGALLILDKNGPDFVFLTFIINSLLVIATIVLAVFAVIQAIAAKRSADTAERTLRLLAADIHVEAMGLAPRGQIGPHSYVAVQLKNYGSSRADKVRSFIKVTIPGVPESVPSPEEFTIPPQGTQLVRFLEFIEFVNQPTFIKIANGALSVKVSGSVAYVDIFGSSKTLEIKEGVLDPTKGVFHIGKPPEEENEEQSNEK